MIEPVSAYGVHQVENPYETQSADFGPGKVGSGDQQRFEALLSRTEGVAQDGQGLQVAQSGNGDVWIKEAAPVPGPALPPPSTIGDSILSGMQGFKDSWNHMIDTIGEMASRPEMTPAELMKLQFEVQQSSISIGLILNEMGSFDQEVSQLLRTS